MKKSILTGLIFFMFTSKSLLSQTPSEAIDYINDFLKSYTFHPKSGNESDSWQVYDKISLDSTGKFLISRIVNDKVTSVIHLYLKGISNMESYNHIANNFEDNWYSMKLTCEKYNCILITSNDGSEPINKTDARIFRINNFEIREKISRAFKVIYTYAVNNKKFYSSDPFDKN